MLRGVGATIVDAGHRTAVLPGERRLVVRPVAPDDLDALVALYEGLDDQDRHRRFFSIHHPPRAFFERLADPGAWGGGRVVAVVEAPSAPDELVGEAGYEPLANGNGDLDVTVDRAWRGWLGHYLLDALLEVAAARSVDNLEAEVLAANGPMLALLRARGYATLPTDDPAVIRLVIASRGPVPRWAPDDPRPRLLEEGPASWFRARSWSGNAQELHCPGPQRLRHGCPAMAGGPCPLASAADLIVVHPLDRDGGTAALLAAHRRLHPRVEVRRP